MISRPDDKVSQFFLFTMLVIGLAWIWFQYHPQVNDLYYYLWILTYVVINLLLSKLAKIVITIIFWLITVPVLLSVALFGGEQSISKSEGLYQFAVLTISYIVIWGYGAFSFNEKQYKTAVSFIGALLATMLAFVAFVCYYPQSNENRILPEYIYKYLTIIISPLILGGLWGKFCLDLKDQLNSNGQTLKRVLINCLVRYFG